MIHPNANIDLHTHSICSDGRGSVQQVMQEAKEAGLDIVALTDHDTTQGWPAARAACDELGLGFVPGIEVTTRTQQPRPDGSISKFTVHMLAYLPDETNAPLKKMLEDSVNSRRIRLQEITEKLSADYDIDWQAVEATLAEGQTAGRPAIADAMINRGIISKRDDFFEFVRPGTKYYVPNRGVPTPEEAIDIIRGAGGVPIVAHPMARGMGPRPGDAMPLEHFTLLIERGLGGFETNHRDVPEHVREWLEKLAFENDLITTGSSDYHGTGKENRLGENQTSPQMLQRIIEQSSGSKPNF
jgi:predicted metal-dependent phosphoesterase TrpH